MVERAETPIPENVDPVKLTDLLEDIGWTLKGRREGSYNRLAPPIENLFFPGSLLIPLDRTAPEFYDSLHSALLQLSQDRDLWTRTLYPRLAVGVSDAFHFRKESSAPSGLIAWDQGEQLIRSARRTLLAGAKSFIAPVRHFSNKFGQFANRYLDNVLMGQTEPGSYIVTAYAPVSTLVSLKGGYANAPDLEYSNVAQTREISLAVVRAIEATVEALDHYRQHGSLAGFDNGVPRGISYEMTSALAGIASNSDGADISISWNKDDPIESGAITTSFELMGSDAVVLEKAANSLVQDESTLRITIIGRVHLLSRKEAGGPGVFGIESLTSDGPRKARVRLASSEDYHEAVRAHDEELALRVSGDWEQSGTLSWLYNAHIVELLGPISEVAPRRARDFRREQIEGQGDLFDGLGQ
jgi:hypothetical protein